MAGAVEVVDLPDKNTISLFSMELIVFLLSDHHSPTATVKSKFCQAITHIFCTQKHWTRAIQWILFLRTVSNRRKKNVKKRNVKSLIEKNCSKMYLTDLQIPQRAISDDHERALNDVELWILATEMEKISLIYSIRSHKWPRSREFFSCPRQKQHGNKVTGTINISNHKKKGKKNKTQLIFQDIALFHWICSSCSHQEFQNVFAVSLWHDSLISQEKFGYLKCHLNYSSFISRYFVRNFNYIVHIFIYGTMKSVQNLYLVLLTVGQVWFFEESLKICSWNAAIVRCFIFHSLLRFFQNNINTEGKE